MKINRSIENEKDGLTTRWNIQMGDCEFTVFQKSESGGLGITIMIKHKDSPVIIGKSWTVVDPGDLDRPVQTTKTDTFDALYNLVRAVDKLYELQEGKNEGRNIRNG